VASRAPFPLSADWLAWLRPASFLLRLGGLTVAVDPVLSARILGAGQRFTRPVLRLDRIPVSGIDVAMLPIRAYAPRWFMQRTCTWTRVGSACGS
jgi:L-ascorbate metabolism protein UlaG (beta-lactamase superfamily)